MPLVFFSWEWLSRVISLYGTLYDVQYGYSREMVNDDDILLFIQTTVRTMTLRTMMITLWTMTITGCTMTITNNTIVHSHFRILRLLWTLSVSLVDVEL